MNVRDSKKEEFEKDLFLQVLGNDRPSKRKDFISSKMESFAFVKREQENYFGRYDR